MSKILVIADVHIYNYPNYNLFEDNEFRLKQFIRLSERLKEIYQSEGCSKIALLGDITHKPIVSPLVAYYIDKFFSNLSEFCDDIDYILGQHDLATKDSIHNDSDSIIHIIAKYAKYRDQQVIKYGGRTIGYSDWREPQDLSFIKDKVDIMFGHYTMSTLFGQNIDNSKFDIGFFGDIHQKNTIGNCHTVNVPLPHYLSDDQDGSVIVLDTDDLSWKRIGTETKDFRFLKIVYDDNKLLDLNDPYIVSVPRPKTVATIDDVVLSIDIDKIISEILPEELRSIHNSISQDITDDYAPINLNFIVNNISINNFRSISEYDGNIPDGLVLLSGRNGQGKSSLIQAIDFIFRPVKMYSNLIKIGEKTASIKLDLDYQGINYCITRIIGEESKIIFTINGQPQNANTQADMNKMINENLPFIQLIHILIRNQGQPNLLSNYGYTDRIDLLSKLLGLGKVKALFNLANTKIREYDKAIIKVEAEIKVIEDLIPKYDKDYSSMELESQLLGQASVLKTDIDDHSKKLDSMKNNLSISKEYDALLTKLDIATCDLQDIKLPPLTLEELNNAKISINNKLSEIQSCESDFKSKIAVQSAHISGIKAETVNVELTISTLKSNPPQSKCVECGREFDNQEEILSHHNNIIKGKEDYLNDLSIKLVNANKELEDLNKQFKDKLESFNKTELLNDLNMINDGIHICNQYANKQKDIESIRANISNYISLHSDLDLDNFIRPDNEDINKLVNYVLDKTNELNNINLKLNDIKHLKEDYDYKLELLNKHRFTSGILKDINNNKSLMYKYSKYFHANGPVINSIFTQISHELSDGDFKVTTVKTLSDGSTSINFNIEYKVDNNFIPYEMLSGGQKTLVDVFFLTRLFKISGRVGMFILDESLKDLDTDNLELAANIIMNSPINTTLLVTHNDLFTSYSSKLRVFKDSDGNTKYLPEG